MRDRTHTVDINTRMYERPYYKQFDNNIPFRINLIENGANVDLTGYTIKAFFNNKSEIIQKNCIIKDSIIETILDNNILKNVGEVYVEFCLIKDETIVTTFTITLRVEKSINRNEAVEKAPGWDIIKDFQTVLDNAIEKVEEDIENKINEVDINESTREKNEINRDNEERLRVSAEENRVLNENTRQAKEQERVNAEEERKSNEIDRQTAYKEIQDARKDFNNKDHYDLSERLNADMGYINDRFNKASLLEYDSNYITANKSYDGVTKDLKIKGQTLQNIVKSETMPVIQGGIQGSSIVDKGEYYEVTFASGQPYPQTRSNLILLSDLKDNTEYTIIYDRYSVDDFLLIRDDTNSKNLASGFTNTLKFTTGTNGKSFAFYVSRSGSNVAETIVMKRRKKFIILEGDWTNKSISYFEGIKSVGEESNKVEILSIGKNLINLNDIDFLKGAATELVEKNSNSIIVRSNVAQSYGHMYGFFKEGLFKPNANYRVSFKSESNRVDAGKCIGIRIFKDNNFNSVVAYSKGTNTFSFSVSSNIKGLGIAFYTNIKDNSGATYTLNKYYDIQIEEVMQIDDTEIIYEPYKEDKISVALNEPLRSLPNEVNDEIDLENSKLIRRIGKYIIQGTENIVIIDREDFPEKNSDYFVFDIRTNLKVPTYAYEANQKGLISDKFISGYSRKEVVTSLLEGICFSRSNIYVSILKSKLPTQDIQGFKTWLKDNPITVYYELLTPTETSIELPKSIRTYDGTTNIFTENTLIKPNLYCKVSSDVVTALDIRHSTSKNKLFGSADERIEEIEEDIKNIVTKENWIEPTLLNGFTNIDNLKTRYRKLTDGTVYVEINVNGTQPNKPIFILPQNYRPSLSAIFAASMNNLFGNILVADNGGVYHNSGALTNIKTIFSFST